MGWRRVDYPGTRHGTSKQRETRGERFLPRVLVPSSASNANCTYARTDPVMMVGQAERDRLLARVRAHGFIDDYEGVRIAKDGPRFGISGAVVWMVVVEGATHGQAALFREWAPA